LKSRQVILALFLILVFIFPDQSVAQCAMCKSAAESSIKNDPSSMAKNLNTGILYLMAVPYLAIAFIFRKQIVALYKRWRGIENPSEETTL